VRPYLGSLFKESFLGRLMNRKLLDVGFGCLTRIKSVVRLVFEVVRI